MTVQRWRWWQWFLVSLLVGGTLGFVFTRMDVDDTSIATRDVGFMLRLLNQRTDSGESLVDGIRVSPPVADVKGTQIENVTFWVRRKSKTTGSWDRTEQFQARVGRPLFKNSKDPNYGIRDFLTEQQKQIPTLDWRYNFYQEPRFVWAASILGSVLGIGVLWPMLIRAMVKMGLGLPETEEEAGFDLSRASSATQSDTLPDFAGVGVTDADRNQLDSLNDHLEAAVSGMLIEKETVDEAAEIKAEEAVIRKLAGQAVTDEPAPVTNNAGPREFGGEFYPVARPTVAKKDDA